MRWIIGFADFFFNFRSSTALDLLILFFLSHSNRFETLFHVLAEGEISFFFFCCQFIKLNKHCAMKFATIWINVNFYYFIVTIVEPVSVVRLTNRLRTHLAHCVNACSVHRAMSEAFYSDSCKFNILQIIRQRPKLLKKKK